MKSSNTLESIALDALSHEAQSPSIQQGEHDIPVNIIAPIANGGVAVAVICAMTLLVRSFTQLIKAVGELS
ncbi:MAG: hypothetical protein F6K11_09420 [Leptolyngbya sp. SIO3F4]|nr:hypothetical protein [Leptolyngbya sp. SIO3F4]